MASPPPNARRHRPRNIIEHGLQYFVERICTYAAIACFGVVIVSVVVSSDPNVRNFVLGVWRGVQLLLGVLNGTASVLGTTAGLSLKLWCALPGPGWGCGGGPTGSTSNPITLELAAHRVKHTAVTSLDVFESFARGMDASLADRVSYIDLWAMSDAVAVLDHDSNIPEAGRLASSLVVLKDTVMQVEDGVSAVNRAGWHAFSSIERWIGRVHDAILRQRAAGIVDAHELHTLLSQMGVASRKNIDDLIERIDKTLVHTRVGLGAASDVRRHALVVNGELTRRLDDRSLPKKIWQAGSHAVRTAKAHSKNVQLIYEATNDVQAQLGLVRRYLVDYQSNAANFHSEINAMEILSLEQELRELELVGNKIQKVLEDAKRTNRDAHDASKPRIETK